MNNDLKLSIIIVSYNTKNFLKDCLESIFQKIKKTSFEVLVVDNGSVDKSEEMVEKEFPLVRVIKNKENVGFAKANNQGIKEAKGEYIFLLNPDTLILDDNINELIDFFDSQKEIGIIGPKVLNADYSFQRQCKRGWPTFWNSFCYVSGLWKILNKTPWQKKVFGGYFLLDKNENEISEVQQISGSAMIVRKKVFEQVGLLDENYFLYWEDSDFCFRVQEKNWKIYYYPFFRVLHYGGKGGTQRQPLKNLWYFHRGLFIFYRRYLAPNSFFLINIFYYLLIGFMFLFKLFINLFRKEKIIGSVKPKAEASH